MAGPGKKSAKLGKTVIIPYNYLEPEPGGGALDVTEVTEAQRGCDSLEVTQVRGGERGTRASRAGPHTPLFLIGCYAGAMS